MSHARACVNDARRIRNGRWLVLGWFEAGQLPLRGSYSSAEASGSMLPLQGVPGVHPF